MTVISSVLEQLDKVVFKEMSDTSTDELVSDLLIERLDVDKSLRSRRFWRAKVPAQDAQGRQTTYLALEVEAPDRGTAFKLATEQARFLAKERKLWLIYDDDMDSLEEYSQFLPIAMGAMFVSKDNDEHVALAKELRTLLRSNAKRRAVPHLPPLVAYFNEKRNTVLVASISEAPKYLKDGYRLIGSGAPFAVLSRD